MNLPARPRLVSNTPAPPPGGQTPAVEHGSGAPARSALDKHVLDYLDQGLCIFDSDQRLVLANARFLEIYGLSLRQAQPGMPFVELVAQRFRTGLLAEDLASILAQEGAPPTSHPPDETQILDDGRCIIVRRRPMQHGGWMVTYEDVTERCRAEQRIQHMALHDALTGLPNRLVLRRRLLAALHSAHSGDAVALHCIDLDRFKLVNDTYGHGVGDKLLKIVGERLRASVRTTDTVARLGGDEFAIVQPGVRRQSDAATLAERIIARLSEPMRIDEKIIDIGASIGIAMTQQGEIDEDALMRHADVALYRAKNTGRGACRFFEPSMANELRDKHLLEADLRLAVARRQLVLHYQPLMDLATMRVCGFEALLRWQHPERG
ncbi:MAG: diguanylate cyclase, partial [Hyphomicrobiaceae bacterium]|nr:diguanylate cyclase [Hyphomicrobiaceae bacterium]